MLKYHQDVWLRTTRVSGYHAACMVSLVSFCAPFSMGLKISPKNGFNVGDALFSVMVSLAILIEYRLVTDTCGHRTIHSIYRASIVLNDSAIKWSHFFNLYNRKYVNYACLKILF